MKDVDQVSNEYQSYPAVDWAQKSVLIVEDDRTHRALMNNILQECSFRTSLAENGYVALARLNAGEQFDLVLMDWDMPGIDGLETVREIRKGQAEGRIAYVPVVAFTAHRQKGDMEKCLAAGMDAYLPKDVWLPKWRQTLIDNLLQGLVVGEVDVKSISIPPPDDDIKQTDFIFDMNAFDNQTLEQTAALLKSDFGIAVEEYLEDAAAYIADITQGIQSGDADKAARGSHPLKSNSKGFGLTTLSDVAESINKEARNGNIEMLGILLPYLHEAFRKSEEKLNDTLKSLNHA